jgi:hypothetical protein
MVCVAILLRVPPCAVCYGHSAYQPNDPAVAVAASSAPLTAQKASTPHMPGPDAALTPRQPWQTHAWHGKDA